MTTKQNQVDDERIGQVIDERYEIRKKVAHGGMATVYEAWDKRLTRNVAIKIMHPHLAAGTEGATFVSRFRREARAAAGLHHPGIVTVFDQGIDGQTSYLTMEFVEGTNLRKRLKEVGTFSVGDALKNIQHLLRALAAAHRAGLVHRDVKPENVLINSKGELQLTDFGLARVATEMSTSTTGTVFGTVAYLAPEIIETGQSDERADNYSIGVMLYELIAGVQPYEGSTPIQVAFKHVSEDVPVLSDIYPEIPRVVSLLISVLCARDKQNRPLNAQIALEKLSKVARTLTAAELSVKLPRPEITSDLADEQINIVPLDAEGDSSDGSPSGSPSGSASGSPEDESAFDNYSGGLGGEQSQPVFPENSVEDFRSVEDSHPTQDPTGIMSEQDEIPTNIITASQLDEIRGATGSNTHATAGIPNLESDSSIDLPQKKKRKKLRLILTVVITVLLAVLVGAIIWWYQMIGPGSKIQIPNGLVGTNQSKAEGILRNAQIQYEISEQYDDNVTLGSVVLTDPVAGELINKRTGKVKIVVSMGIQHITMPDGIVGIKTDDAVKKLKTLGFNEPKIEHTFSTEVEKDLVISVSPSEGTNQEHNVEIVLRVSDGPTPVNMPDLIGDAFDDAATQLANLGLQYARSDDFSDDVPVGSVISQSVKAGDGTFEGQTVTLVVSKGTKLVAVPDLRAKSIGDAEQLLTATGLKFKTAGESDLGLVQKQDVPAGTKVERDTVITLTVV